MAYLYIEKKNYIKVYFYSALYYYI